MPATSTVHQKAQTDQLLRRLGRLGGHGEAAARSERPHLRLVQPAALALLLSPLTAFTRTVDSSGRLKLTGAAVPSTLFGWEPGILDVDAFEGWLTLRQPADRSAGRPERFSSAATLSHCANGPSHGRGSGWCSHARHRRRLQPDRNRRPGSYFDRGRPPSAAVDRGRRSGGYQDTSRANAFEIANESIVVLALLGFDGITGRDQDSQRGTDADA